MGLPCHSALWIGLVMAVISAPITAKGEVTLMVETRQLPQSCADTEECVAGSTVILRNMMTLELGEAQTLARVLNTMPGAHQVPDDAMLPACSGLLHASMHSLPMASKPALLVGHPGVYFDASKLDATEATFGFATYLRDRLTAAGLRFLTKEEMEATPGRPVLSLRYSPRRESAGCIIPYSLSLSIKEEAVLTRNPAKKVPATVWSATTRENLANLHYKLDNALDETIEKFLKDWTEANPKG